MGARGKKAASELSIVKHGDITAIERAQPPSDLIDEESFEWLAMVNRMPAEWFPRETHGLLTQYCRHVVAARRIAQLIEEFLSDDNFDVCGYDRLLKMQEREGRAISSLATRMRTSQHSTINHKVKKPKGTRKPWD
jgi:hypothetical protein